jgi:DNA-binding NtrC family response regulator
MLPAVLIIEDDPQLGKNIQTYLSRGGFEVHKCQSGGDGLKAFERFKPDVVLLDLMLPDIEGLQVLERLRALDPHVKVIIITGQECIDVAVAAMKAGAHDYLRKPLVLKALRLLVTKAVDQDRLEGTLSYYHQKEASESGIDKLLGTSGPMRALKARIRQFVEAEYALRNGTPPSLLITGETGTGKQLVARAMHFDGPRRDKPFIELNCAAIPSHLLEAELFGYERGAFTDARERKAGLAEAADGGTLFLDEIGDIDPSVQSKLLKLLEDKVVRRLGGLRDRQIDVRFITATNQPLRQRVEEGRFRADLYYRLRVVQLEMPSLRERANDILVLAEHFVELACSRYAKPKLRFGEAAKAALLRHGWPGNVRELRNCIEQTVLLATGSLIEPDQLALYTPIPQPGEPGRAKAQPSQFFLPEGGVDLQNLERQLVTQALEKTSGNVTKAAKLLGLSRDTLRYRIEKFALGSNS